MSAHGSSGAVVTGAVTAFVATVPADVLTYAEKVGSVFFLAMIAELGRRVFTYLLDRIRKGSKK